MPAFSNANDKTAIIAIRVKILFFLMKSIIHFNNLLIKFSYKVKITRIIITISMEPIYVGGLVPSIASYKKVIEKYDKGIKEGEFYEEPICQNFNYLDW